MEDDLEKVLLTEEAIRRRIEQVAADVSRDYRGREPVLVTVLKGAVFFMTALARSLTIPVRLDFLGIASFSPGRALPGVVRIVKDLDESIQGMDVLLVEDIVDTGLTLRYLMSILEARKPASLAVCTFLDKASRRLVDVPIQYRCFEIPDRFVVGFGLDYAQRYRTLPCVGILKSHVYDREQLRREG